MHSESTILEHTIVRKKVADTDTGKRIKDKISDIEKLLVAYRKGILTKYGNNLEYK